MKKKILHSGQALQQAAERGCGISVIGNIQNMTEKALSKLMQPFKDCLEMEIGLDDFPRQNPVIILWFYDLAISHVKKATLLGQLRTQPECHVQEGNNLFSVSTDEK